MTLPYRVLKQKADAPGSIRFCIRDNLSGGIDHDFAGDDLLGQLFHLSLQLVADLLNCAFLTVGQAHIAGSHIGNPGGAEQAAVIALFHVCFTAS